MNRGVDKSNSLPHPTTLSLTPPVLSLTSPPSPSPHQLLPNPTTLTLTPPVLSLTPPPSPSPHQFSPSPHHLLPHPTSSLPHPTSSLTSSHLQVPFPAQEQVPMATSFSLLTCPCYKYEQGGGVKREQRR
ncbi:hypothetical protein Pmani_037235 [Petrolisthes manimaculis]|uniref:Uncharacterized protein n=1 Tax=Petrolisthes manimaculis TaxID=1843537 RepID=A0AAE1TNH0_9EUCA|nr:hypothetical protein Pmani_037235 [Petrolisthes manimaculis]